MTGHDRKRIRDRAWRRFRSLVALWSGWTMTSRWREMKQILDLYESIAELPPAPALIAAAVILAGREDAVPAKPGPRATRLERASRVIEFGARDENGNEQLVMRI